MKRKNLIIKLINEGFTEKTLVNMTDKQLHILSERVFNEQVAKPILNIPNTDTAKIVDAKNKKQTFVTYEGEMSEDVSKEKKKNEEKEIVLKRINYKIESKMKKDESVKSEVELLKRMGEKIPEKVQKYCDARKVKVKEKEKVEVDEQVSKNLNTKETAKKWVNRLVENKYFTSKNEIMNLIQSKLNEQEVAEPEVDVDVPEFLTYDAIKASGEQPMPAEPITKPGTKPRTRPTPKTPFQPGPGPKHNPKASMEEDKK
jgi:hypothetical protein